MQDLTPFQRQLRQNIRNCYLIATLEELRTGLGMRQDEFSRSVLQEMIDACEKHGVDSHGKVPV